MTDYSEGGAVPVEDAVVPDPPTVDEVLAERDRRESEDEEDEADGGDPSAGR
jgi:hypothetical protein